MQLVQEVEVVLLAAVVAVAVVTVLATALETRVEAVAADLEVVAVAVAALVPAALKTSSPSGAVEVAHTFVELLQSVCRFLAWWR